MDDTPPLALDAGPRPPSPAEGKLSGAGRAFCWLRDSLRGLTWQRYGVFCMVAFAFATTRPGVSRALGDPAFTGLGSALAMAFPLSLVHFTPVLLAVVFVTNRGPQRGGWQIAALAAAVLVGSIVGQTLFANVALMMDAKRFAWVRLTGDPVEYLLRRSGAALVDAMVSVTAVAFWYFFKRDVDAVNALQRERHDQEEVERETAEARLQVMRAQIEPHFLFNTLASIRRLYETDAVAGRSMLRHLSRYLTVSLPILRETRSTLGRELALTVAYLNVQKIRMGARLTVEVDVPSTLHPVEVPPMMLATLVENAVIHGLGPLPAGGTIRITARRRQGNVVVEVIDTGRGLQDTWGVGIGLANVRARLATQYGTAAELRLVDNRPNPGVTATLVLPMPAGEAVLAA